MSNTQQLFKVEYKGKTTYFSDKVEAKIARRNYQRDPTEWRHGDPIIQPGPDHWAGGQS